jgi:excisionase family DNA binding protein
MLKELPTLSVTPIAQGRRPPPEPPPRLVPILDTIPILGISKNTVYRLLHAGRFPIEPVRIGRRWFVRSVDIDALVARAS